MPKKDIHLSNEDKLNQLFESANDGDTIDVSREDLAYIDIGSIDDCMMFSFDDVPVKTFSLRTQNGEIASVTVNSDGTYHAVWNDDSNMA